MSTRTLSHDTISMRRRFSGVHNNFSYLSTNGEMCTGDVADGGVVCTSE